MCFEWHGDRAGRRVGGAPEGTKVGVELGFGKRDWKG